MIKIGARVFLGIIYILSFSDLLNTLLKCSRSCNMIKNENKKVSPLYTLHSIPFSLSQLVRLECIQTHEFAHGLCKSCKPS